MRVGTLIIMIIKKCMHHDARNGSPSVTLKSLPTLLRYKGAALLEAIGKLSNVVPYTRSQRSFARIFRRRPSAVDSRFTTSWLDPGGAGAGACVVAGVGLGAHHDVVVEAGAGA